MNDTSPHQRIGPASLGHGVGLRLPHYAVALDGEVDVDWLEVVTENFLGGGGRPKAVLAAAAQQVPIVLHGVSLNIGSTAGPNPDYLRRLAELAAWVRPAWISDHLCWTGGAHTNTHDLLPIPYTQEALDLVVTNVQRVQDALGCRLVLENPSSYVGYRHSELDEAHFLAEVATRSDCLILLDLNNVLVSAKNFGFDPLAYLEAIPGPRVQQFHLANHSDRGAYKFDDHRGAVPEAVWQLYELAVARFGDVSSLVEWDTDVPSWSQLRAQAQQAAHRAAKVGSRTTSHSREGSLSLASVPGDPPPPRVPGQTLALAATQDLFLQAIAAPKGIADFLASCGTQTRTDFNNCFAESQQFTRTARVEVYASGYFWRLAEVLREQFELCAWLCGEPNFHNALTDYLLKHPSTSPDIRQCGRALPNALADSPWAEHVPGIAELAGLEWGFVRALDAPDQPTLTTEDLSQIPLAHWPDARFSVSHTLTLTACALPFVELRTRMTQGLAVPTLSAGTPSWVAVWRRADFELWHRGLATAEAEALQIAQRGGSFTELCDHTAQGPVATANGPTDPARTVAGWLRQWLTDGLLIAVTTPDASTPDPSTRAR